MTHNEPDAEVRALSQRVLSTLISKREIEHNRLVLLVERRRVGAAWSELVEFEDADLFTVSLGYPGSSREVWVDIDRAARPQSLAEAASTLGDAFQDEVIELLHEARPTCHSHPHPMSINRAGLITSWRCPADPSEEIRVWP